MSIKVKIVNDPVYGFIRFPEHELVQVIDHPWFQRLRNIKQMGLAHLVYPGAEHTRFAHSLGACHLMGKAIDELKAKNIEPSKEECLAARLAALLHDVGHGPYSHSLEHTLVNVHHEALTRLIMRRMNKELDGMLDGAINIFDNRSPSGAEGHYLHQLVSSQMDVDRMDYLNRDSFYTGVSEGVIGYDRILQMLTVRNNELMVEEKGVHSVEKFIIARRLMYWQVYLHKTVLGAEALLINILTRAKELARAGEELFATPALKYFLYQNLTESEFNINPEHLDIYCQLTDTDVMASIKVWQTHSDKTLSMLCKMLILRKLYKVVYGSASLASNLEEKREQVKAKYGFSEDELKYFVFDGKTSSSTYNVNDELIKFDMKNGDVKNITEIDDSLVNKALARAVHKNYICYIQ